MMSDYKNKTVEKRNKTKYPNGEMEKKYGKTLLINAKTGKYREVTGDSRWDDLDELLKWLECS